MSVRVEHGDCRDVVKTLADASVDSCVTDPPYSLVSIQRRFGKPGSAPAKEGTDGLYRRASAGFMGKQWDTGETAFDPDWWREVYRVLKPGAHLVAFSGTRTYHRMACAIEDAGFEIRDMLSWNYGSGFPKSRSMRAIGRPELGTALKPAHEPIVLARKPLHGTVAATVLAHGTGAINIDGCRVGTGDDKTGGGCAGTGALHGGGIKARAAVDFSVGRWPANLLHDGGAEVLEAFKAYGESQSRVGKPRGADAGEGWGMTRTGAEYADTGSAARFFFSAKAGEDDRADSKHPTVKPVALMRWLARLITPPGVHVCENCGIVPHHATIKAQSPSIEAVRGVRDDLRPVGRAAEPDQEFLFPQVRQPRDSEDATIDEGLRDVAEGVSVDIRTEASRRAQDRLHRRASAGDGESNGSTAEIDGGCASSERCEGRQQTREPRSDEQEKTRSAQCSETGGRDRVPALPKSGSPESRCACCGGRVTERRSVVLDPFAGSGTTGVAAIREGFDAILIEREAEYHKDIRHRLDKLSGLDTPLFARAAE